MLGVYVCVSLYLYRVVYYYLVRHGHGVVHNKVLLMEENVVNYELSFHSLMFYCMVLTNVGSNFCYLYE